MNWQKCVAPRTSIVICHDKKTHFTVSQRLVICHTQKNPVRQPGEIKHVRKKKIASRHNDDCNAHPCYKALLCVKDIDGHQK